VGVWVVMSLGDTNTHSIPAIYKGIQMRSKLETKVALFLDYLKIEWKYEPKTFLLSNGIYYKPDFFLPEHKQWIEVKGVIGENNIEISKCFVKDTQQPIILISSKEVLYFDSDYLPDITANDRDGKDGEKGFQIGLCSNCHTNFICSLYGSFHCRKCGNHEGDHDIHSSIGEDGWGRKGDWWNLDNDIDFSRIESIKQWLGDNGTRT